MTVLPVPVTAPEPVASDAPAKPAEPGFAEKLARARNDGATKATEREPRERVVDDTPSGDEQPEPKRPAMAATDAAVVAVLAALTQPAPVAPDAPADAVLDVAVVTEAGEEGVAVVLAAVDDTASAEIAPAETEHGDDNGVDAALTIEAGEPVADEAPAAATTADGPGETAEYQRPVDVAAPEPAVAAPTAERAFAAENTGAQADAPSTALPVTTNITAARAEHSAAPAPTTNAAPAPPPPPAEQLVSVLKPLQRDADGTYTLKLEMKPPELGRVEMRIEVRDGVMHASIRAEHAHTANLVRDSLDDLRAQLTSDGVLTGELSVDDGRTNQREREDTHGAAATEQSEPAPEVATRRPVEVTRSDALVDVRV